MTHKILVIDDEPGFCEILEYILSKDGYEVDTVDSAVEALNLDLSKYSLLIVDINMERINGFEFVNRISQKSETKYTPVIFCSANVQEDFILNGFDLGADDYITKPFDFRTVSRRVKAVLNRCYPDTCD